MDRIFAKVEDWWLTRRTGKDKATRDYEEWFHQNVNVRADTAERRFKNFKYLIQVDYWKCFDEHMFTELKEELRQYRWPNREMGDNMVYAILRGYQCSDGFLITDIGGHEDRVYIATNNHEDAIMLALKYR